MAIARKFTFDINFDDPLEDFMRAGDSDASTILDEPEIEPEPVIEDIIEESPPETFYTEEDLQLARDEAYVTGHTDALSEAGAASQRAAAEAMGSIVSHLAGLAPQIAKSTAEISQLATHVAMEVCRTLLPNSAEDYAASEIAALVESLIPELTREPRLTVRVHSKLVEILRPRIDAAAHQAGFEGRIVVLEDPRMQASDARVEWADGGAERNTSRLWADIEALLNRNVPRFARGEALELQEPEAEPADLWPAIDAAAHYVYTPAAPEIPALNLSEEEAVSDELAPIDAPAADPADAPADAIPTVEAAAEAGLDSQADTTPTDPATAADIDTAYAPPEADGDEELTNG